MDVGASAIDILTSKDVIVILRPSLVAAVTPCIVGFSKRTAEKVVELTTPTALGSALLISFDSWLAVAVLGWNRRDLRFASFFLGLVLSEADEALRFIGRGFIFYRLPVGFATLRTPMCTWLQALLVSLLVFVLAFSLPSLCFFFGTSACLVFV